MRVGTPIINDLRNLMVSDLFLSGTKSWNMELVNEIFNARDVLTIQSIPCNFSKGADTCIWQPSSNGVYSVKTGYHISTVSLSSNKHLRILSPWQKLWERKIPHKVCTFLWRAARYCLPNRYNLQRRGIQVFLSCVLFDGYHENTWHQFISCPYAQACELT